MESQRALLRLDHYKTKCLQHLSRVRLSHLNAVSNLESVAKNPSIPLREALSQSFHPIPGSIHIEEKLRDIINSVHFVALKFNFELYLNRALTALWHVRHADYVKRMDNKRNVSLRSIATTLSHATTVGQSGMTALIDQIVPRHGLDDLVRSIERFTACNPVLIFNNSDCRLWPQIKLSFEIRHLIEHRDGKLDSEFRDSVHRLWPATSWAERLGKLSGVSKIQIHDTDLEATLEAMKRCVELLHYELLNSSHPH